MSFADKLKKAWNAIKSSEEQAYTFPDIGPGSHYQSHRTRTYYSSEKSIIASIYTRIGIDVASIELRHIKVDESGQFLEDKRSNLQNALEIEPNLDQGPRQWRQDIVQTMFDEGVAAIVPVETSGDPSEIDTFDVYTMRVGRVKEWFPRHVTVEVYNDSTGQRQEVTLPKSFVPLVENPMFSVMNEPNSTLQRLIRKLSILDVVDDRVSSGKLDLIVQLPFVVKSEFKKNEAEKRTKAIEEQLSGSAYGVAWADATEKITQLNRPAENNLLAQVEYLTDMLYSQLGITTGVMDGTADEKAMIYYYNRTVEPILTAIVESMNRTLLGPLGSRKKEKIRFFRDPFKLVPLGDLAEIVDKFTRNEVLTANEVRSYMGIPPSKDPKANELRNSNMPKPIDDTDPTSEGEDQNGS